MTRKQSRESAFQIVFEMNLNDIAHSEAVALAEAVGEPEVDDFSKALIAAAAEHKDQIDAMILPYLKGWTIERISKPALAVLRISCAQLLCFADIPDSIVINEAVEIAKKYGADEDYSFVNGVLGSIVRSKDHMPETAGEPWRN